MVVIWLKCVVDTGVLAWGGNVIVKRLLDVVPLVLVPAVIGVLPWGSLEVVSILGKGALILVTVFVEAVITVVAIALILPRMLLFSIIGIPWRIAILIVSQGVLKEISDRSNLCKSLRT